MTRSQAPVYLILLQHPVVDKHQNIITTAIKNLDIHDGGRLAGTYGLQKFFIVTPLGEQRALVHRVCSHWVTGPGARKNPTRRQAMEKLVSAHDLQEVCNVIEEQHGEKPLLVGTSAKATKSQQKTYPELREQLLTGTRPIGLIFGTGWGIPDEITPAFDYYLPPVFGPTNYNHLSVRSAMAIVLDRLLHAEPPTPESIHE